MWSKQTNPSLWHLNRTTCCKPQTAMQLPAKLQCAHIPGAMSAAVSAATFLPVMFSSLRLATLYVSYPSVCFVLCYLTPIAIFKLQNHRGIMQGGKLSCTGRLKQNLLFKGSVRESVEAFLWEEQAYGKLGLTLTKPWGG